MDRVIGWFTKKSTRGTKVAHLWVLSAKDHGQEVTACGKIGERGTARVDADVAEVRDCGRCAEREARLQSPSHASH